MSHIDFCWHFLPDIWKFNLECFVIKTHKGFNTLNWGRIILLFSVPCWAGWQNSHGPLIFWSPHSLRLHCQMAVMFEEGVKKKKKMNRKCLGVITWRRKEWVRQRESVKVLRWHLEAWWHRQPLKTPFRNAVINCRWNTEIKEKEKKNIRKSLVSHPFCSIGCDLPSNMNQGNALYFQSAAFRCTAPNGTRQIGIRCGSQPDF